MGLNMQEAGQVLGSSQTHTVATLSLPRKKLKLVTSSTRYYTLLSAIYK
jgi:hypothetical protein